MDLKLKGKVAAITGGSRGIGYACAQVMGAEGMSLSICSRNAESLEKAANNLSAQGIRVLATPTDISQKEDLKQWFQKTLEHFGSVDVLVNNAGEGPRGKEAITDKGWQIHFEQYLMGAIHACQLVTPIMTQQKSGCIINISSVAGIMPAIVSPIAVIKAALNNYSIGLAKELATFGIRVISVCPGLVWTRERLMAPNGVADRLARKFHLLPSEALERFVHDNIPMGNLVTAEEVGYLVCFLASNERVGSLTGTIVTIDGGVGRSLLP